MNTVLLHLMGTMAQMATVSSQTQRGTCSRRLRLGYLRFLVLLSGACIAVHCANRALHCVLRSSPSRSARSIHCILHRPSAHGRHYLRLVVERPRLSSHSLCLSVCLSVSRSLSCSIIFLSLPFSCGQFFPLSIKRRAHRHARRWENATRCQLAKTMRGSLVGWQIYPSYR